MADNESLMTVQFMRDLNKEVGELKDFMQSEVRALAVAAERSAVNQEHNSEQIRNMDRTLRGNGESVLTRLTALENRVTANGKASVKARQATDAKIDDLAASWVVQRATTSEEKISRGKNIAAIAQQIMVFLTAVSVGALALFK